MIDSEKFHSKMLKNDLILQTQAKESDIENTLLVKLLRLAKKFEFFFFINVNILVLSIFVPMSAGNGTLRSLSDGGGLSFSASFSSLVTPSAFGNREFHFALCLLPLATSAHKHFSSVLVSISVYKNKDYNYELLSIFISHKAGCNLKC